MASFPGSSCQLTERFRFGSGLQCSPICFYLRLFCFKGIALERDSNLCCKVGTTGVSGCPPTMQLIGILMRARIAQSGMCGGDHT